MTANRNSFCLLPLVVVCDYDYDYDDDDSNTNIPQQVVLCKQANPANLFVAMRKVPDFANQTEIFFLRAKNVPPTTIRRRMTHTPTKSGAQKKQLPTRCVAFGGFVLNKQRTNPATAKHCTSLKLI